MSQRSPQNARYQKHTKPSGQTRRSAASAKPKRAATSTPAKGSTGSSSSRAKFVGTPEYKKWRNIWWGLLGTATVVAVAYWPLFQFKAPLPVSYTAIGIAYALLAASIWVDFKKVRPLRFAIEQGGSKKEKAPKTDRSADKADGGADE